MGEIRFEPTVLKWARVRRFGPKIEVLTAKIADAADQLDVDRIIDWENGLDQPTFSDVKNLAILYKRPLAVFFLNSPPDDGMDIPDLRTIGSKDNETLSPDALLVMRKARSTQRIAGVLREELGDILNFQYSKVALSENPERLAEKIRADFNVSIGDQFKLNYENFFEYLRSKIEATGVITLKSGTHDSFPAEDCRAFSFADKLPYLILVNNKDTAGAKIFSLVHEFAHILLRETGICNNLQTFSRGKYEISPVEVFCNRFAAGFLTPMADFKDHYALRDIEELSPSLLDEITKRIAADFKVSRVVVLRRLLALGFLSKEVYRQKVEDWSAEFYSRPESSGGVFSLKTILRKNGKAFSALVVEAHGKNQISRANASEYLGLKTKHLSNFEKMLGSYAW